MDMTGIDIRDELRNQGVVGRGGEGIPTSTLFLTFSRPELPTTIEVGCLQVRVVVFIPNPLRCFNCNRFGHVGQRCKVAAGCELCGRDKRDGQCDGPGICSTCSGSRASSSGDCPVWRREKETQHVCVGRCISFPEARQLIEGGSSSVVPVGVNQGPCSGVVSGKWARNIECPTDLAWVSSGAPVQSVRVPVSTSKSGISVAVQSAAAVLTVSDRSEGLAEPLTLLHSYS